MQNKKFVYLVCKDNKVKYSDIRFAPIDGGINYIVTDGLRPGDRYVSKGITSLQDGMEIKPITEAQYQKKIDDAAKLGEGQNSASAVIDALSSKK